MGKTFDDLENAGVCSAGMSKRDEQKARGLKAAKDAAGNARELAKLLGVSDGAISKWRDGIPLEWVERVEKVTGIHRSILRPDMGFKDPPPPRSKKRAR